MASIMNTYQRRLKYSPEGMLHWLFISGLLGSGNISSKLECFSYKSGCDMHTEECLNDED